MAELRLEFVWRRDTRRAVRFGEVPAARGTPLGVGTLYVEKRALRALGGPARLIVIVRAVEGWSAGERGIGPPGSGRRGARDRGLPGVGAANRHRVREPRGQTIARGAGRQVRRGGVPRGPAERAAAPATSAEVPLGHLPQLVMANLAGEDAAAIAAALRRLDCQRDLIPDETDVPHDGPWAEESLEE